MQVGHALAGFRTCVDHQPVAASAHVLPLRERAGQAQHCSKQRRIVGLGVIERRYVLRRDYEDVSWCHRMRIAEGDDSIITIDNRGL